MIKRTGDDNVYRPLKISCESEDICDYVNVHMVSSRATTAEEAIINVLNIRTHFDYVRTTSLTIYPSPYSISLRSNE